MTTFTTRTLHQHIPVTGEVLDYVNRGGSGYDAPEFGYEVRWCWERTGRPIQQTDILAALEMWEEDRGGLDVINAMEDTCAA